MDIHQLRILLPNYTIDKNEKDDNIRQAQRACQNPDFVLRESNFQQAQRACRNPDFALRESNFALRESNFCIKIYDDTYDIKNIEELENEIDIIKNIHDNRNFLCEFLELNDFIKIKPNLYTKRNNSIVINIKILINYCCIRVQNGSYFSMESGPIDNIFEQLKIILNINSRNKLVNE